ncbi:hypothetical protein EDD86DRAFT_260977 [Gorgonomyces haynaldii]|nr:hypothetical protein EDD86DRAFT_250362 [Gorgonomyces haynaldii]KAI8903887.1 hypothetical protein EDD86DRAFT_260977 [Gorgonomyces haynaldii]
MLLTYPENINEFLSTIDISSPAVFGERVIFTEFDAPPNMPIKRQWFVDMIQIVASTLSVINLQQGTISGDLEDVLTIEPTKLQHFIPPRYWQDTGLKGHEFYLGRLKHHFYVSILFVPLDDCACHLRNKEEQSEWRQTIMDYLERVAVYKLPSDVLTRAGWTGTATQPAMSNFQAVKTVQVPLQSECRAFFSELLRDLQRQPSAFFESHIAKVVFHRYGQNQAVTVEDAFEYVSDHFASASIDSYQAAIAVNLKANPTGNVPKLCPALSQQDLMEMFAGNEEDRQAHLNVNAIQIYNVFSHLNRPFAAAEPFANLPNTASVLSPFYCRGKLAPYEKYALGDVGRERSQNAVTAAMEQHLDCRVEVVFSVDCILGELERIADIDNHGIWCNVMNNISDWVSDQVITRLKFYDGENGFPKFLSDLISGIGLVMKQMVEPYILRQKDLQVKDKLLVYILEELLRFVQNGRSNNVSNWIMRASGIRESLSLLGFPYVTTPRFFVHSPDANVASGINPEFLLQRTEEQRLATYLGHLTMYRSTFHMSEAGVRSMLRASIALLELEHADVLEVQEMGELAFEIALQDIGAMTMKHFGNIPALAQLLHEQNESSILTPISHNPQWLPHLGGVGNAAVALVDYMPHTFGRIFQQVELLYGEQRHDPEFQHQREKALLAVHRLFPTTYACLSVLFRFYEKFILNVERHRQNRTMLLTILSKVLEKKCIRYLPSINKGRLDIKQWKRIDLKIQVEPMPALPEGVYVKRGHEKNHRVLPYLYPKCKDIWLSDFLNGCGAKGVMPAHHQVKELLQDIPAPNQFVLDVLALDADQIGIAPWLLSLVLTSEIYGIFQLARATMQTNQLRLRTYDELASCMQYAGLIKSIDNGKTKGKITKKKQYCKITEMHFQVFRLEKNCGIRGLSAKYHAADEFWINHPNADVVQYFFECWRMPEAYFQSVAVGYARNVPENAAH